MKSEKKDIMGAIAEANKPVTKGIDRKDVEHRVTIYVMGKVYEVPATLTIMQAMEYAGYRLIRSCGCRAGFCGACSTMYRKKGEYKLQSAMACQTRVEDGMYLVQIPFVPAEKALYDINEERHDVPVLFKYYPELARCLSCNTCSKSCPQNLEVMDYVQAAIRGDFAAVAEGSFECIQCGLCAVRCPADIVQYHLAQLARRMYGRYGSPEEKNLKNRVEEIRKGKYGDEFSKIMCLGHAEIKNLYTEKQRTREVY